MSRTISIVGLAAVLMARGCAQQATEPASGKVTSGDVRRDAGQAVNTAVEYSQQARDEFQKKLDARLKELDSEIVRLREQGGQLKDDAKVKWEQKLANLETKRAAARVKLEQVRQSSAEAWKDVHQGAQSAWDELEKAFGEASKEF